MRYGDDHERRTGFESTSFGGRNVDVFFIYIVGQFFDFQHRSVTSSHDSSVSAVALSSAVAALQLYPGVQSHKSKVTRKR